MCGGPDPTRLPDGRLPDGVAAWAGLGANRTLHRLTPRRSPIRGAFHAVVEVDGLDSPGIAGQHTGFRRGATERVDDH